MEVVSAYLDSHEALDKVKQELGVMLLKLPCLFWNRTCFEDTPKMLDFLNIMLSDEIHIEQSNLVRLL